MCVAFVCRDKKPSLEILKKCEKSNPHGGGFMHFNFENRVWYKKGLSADEIYELTQKIELPYAIHFRWASSGEKIRSLTHPFEVTETSTLRLDGVCEKALMHNGHFADWRVCLAAAGINEPKSEPISDSRAISMIVSKNNLDFLKKISGYFIVADSTIKKFRLYGEFKEDDGIFYSNLYWKYGKHYVSKGSSCVVYPKDYSRENVYDNDDQDPNWSVDEKKKEKAEKESPCFSKSSIRQIIIPVLDLQKVTDCQAEINKRFNEICPDSLSKKLKKRLWKRFCAENKLHSVSFKNNYVDLKEAEKETDTETKEIQTELSSESLKPDAKPETKLLSENVSNPS